MFCLAAPEDSDGRGRSQPEVNSAPLWTPEETRPVIAKSLPILPCYRSPHKTACAQNVLRKLYRISYKGDNKAIEGAAHSLNVTAHLESNKTIECVIVQQI